MEFEAYYDTSLNQLPEEEWRDIIGFEGLYQVSSLGRVKRLGRISYVKVGGKHAPQRVIERKLRECIFSQVIATNGFLKIQLRNRENKRVSFYVHHLVAKHFMGKPMPKAGIVYKFSVKHKDKNKLNNSVDNLYWAVKKVEIRNTGNGRRELIAY